MSGANGGAAHTESFRDILPELVRLMPAAILDGGGCERMLDRVGHLPGPTTAAFFGLEFRLDEAAPVADFFIPAGAQMDATGFLVREGEAAAPHSPEAALARRLRRTDGFDSVLEDAAILEYDIASAPSGTQRATPPPGIFVRPLSEAGSGAERAPGQVADALAALAARPPDRDERQVVERAFAALPEEALVRHTGVLPGRKPRAIRLVISRATLSRIAAYLERVGHPDPAAVEAAVPPVLRDLCDPRPWLSLDVSASGVSPRVGLEFWPAGYEDDGFAVRWRWLEIGAPLWRPVIGVLEQLGWCLPAKARGLRVWTALDNLFRGGRAFVVYRGISHVKVVIEGPAVYVKAYVGVTCVPMRRGGAAAGSPPGQAPAGGG